MQGSPWTHEICWRCYSGLAPDRESTRLREEMRVMETCCQCGRKTDDGIYYRADPQTMMCKGDHGAMKIPLLGWVD